MLDPEQSPIFVIGTGRSGTTLLRMMMCAHPRIHLTHEASFYLVETLAPKGQSTADFLRFYIQSISFRWLRLDPRPLIAALPHPPTPADRKAFYTGLMRAVAVRHGKPRWGDKTPSHAGNLGRIFEDFPDARVVRIVRDPRAVVRSFQRMPWASASVVGGSALCELERHQVEPFRDRILEVRMEDLLATPREVMQRVLDHVGEPWDEAVLHHHEHLPEPDDLPPVPWFQSAKKPTKPPRAPDFRDWHPVELRLVEHLNRHTMRAFGYVPALVVREPWKLAVFWRWLTELPEVLRSLGVTMKLAAQMKDPGSVDSPASREVFKRLNPAAWDRYPGFEMPMTPPLPEGWDEGL